jgi:hypothetical protein
VSVSADPPRRDGASALRGGATGLAAIAAAVAAPGWVLGLGLVVIAIVVLAQTLLPQESAHRLAWWEARWNHCNHHQPGRLTHTGSTGRRRRTRKSPQAQEQAQGCRSARRKRRYGDRRSQR